MKPDVLPEFPSKNSVGLTQEPCPVGALQSELYRHMAEDISAPAVFVADPGDGYRLLHAGASCRYFGDSHEPLHGMSLPEYIPTLSQAKLKQLWREVGEYNTTSMETDYRLASGSRIAIEITFSPLEHEGRKLMVGYICDISERRALEAERLRLAEEIAVQEIEFRYREIFENVTDGIFLLDVVHGERFRFAGINPSMTRMTGMIQRDILGRFVENIIPEHSARKMIANYRQCVEEGKPIRFEMELELSGSKKIFNSTLIPVRDGFGHIHRIISLSSDTTERKQAEAERGRLIAILEESADFIGSSDMQGNLLYHNRAARRMIGLPDDADLSTMHVSDMHAEWATKLVLETGIPAVLEHGIWRGDNALLHRDGHEIPVSQLLIMHRDADGKPEFTSTIMQDITERKRVEDTLKFIAQRGWAEDGESFLTALARYLGQMLEVDYVIVDKLADDPANAETVAIYAKGEVLPNMQYSLKGTPCANVMGGGLCCHPADVQQRFPEDSLLVDMQVESYAGLPLWDSKGKVIGLIAVMDGKPIDDVATVTSMLQLVATRASAELEREQSERALSESRQFLSQVIETIPDPVFVKDREHRWIRLNQAFCEFIGHPLEALLGKSDYDFFPAHEAEVFWAKDEVVFNSGEENVNEEEFTGSNGTTRTLVTKKTCYTDDRGQQYLVGIILDITERKRMEAELISQTNFQRTLLNAMYDVGMQLMVVENGRISHVGNRKLAYQFGYTDAELDAHPSLVDIIHPDDRARVMDYHVRRMAGEAVPASYELGLLMRGGERREYETSVAIVPDTAPMRIITVGKDITERKRMEELLEQREREFRSLAANLPDNIARWDTGGRIIFSNPTHQRTLGKPAVELIGKTHIEAFPDDRYRPVDTAIAQVVASGEPVMFVRQLVPAENGEMRIHDINLVPEFDDAGQVASVLGIGRDMTDIYSMQEAIAAREQEFRSLADSSPNSIIRYDRDGCIRYLNAKLVHELGVTTADLIGKLPSEVWPDGRYAEIEQAAVQAVETETEVSIEICAQGAGEPGFYQIHVVPERDTTGQVIGTIAFGWDITALKHYTQSLLERAQLEEQLSGVAASVPGFIFTIRRTVDGQTSFPFASTGVEDLFGLRPEDIRDDAAVLRARYHPEDLQCLLVQMDESEKMLSPFRVEIRIFHPEHGQRWIEIRSTPQRHQDGSTEWHGIMLDISERKQRDKQLALQGHALTHVGEAIYLIDEDARILQVNAAASKMLGFSQDELLAMRVYDLDPDFGPEQWRLHWADLLARGTVIVETNHRTNTGGLVPIEVNANYIVHDGRPYNFALVRDITERELVQAAIQRSQSALEEAQRIAHIGSWDWDVVMNSVEWSDMAYEIYTPDERPASPGFEEFKQSVHPDDLEMVVAAVTAAFEQDTPFDIEHRVVSRCKGVRTVHAQAKVFRDAHGKPLRMLGTVQDITERKRLESDLISQADFQKTLLNAMYEVGLQLMMLENGRIIHVGNLKSALKLGLTEEYLATCPPMLDIVHPDDRARVIDNHKRRLAGEVVPTTYELGLVTRDGERREYETSVAVVPGTDPVRVVSIGRDISERKYLEQVLCQRELEFRTLVENLPTYVARLDKKLRYVYANPAFVKSIGVPDVELLGAHASIYLRADNISADAYVALLMRVLHFGKPEDVPLEWTDDAGYLYSHLVRVVPEVDSGGETTGLLVMGFDITERRREQIMEAERQRVFELLSHGGGLNEILNQVARYVEAAKPGRHCCILLLDEQQNRLVSAASPTLPVPCSSSIDGVEVCEESGCCGAAALRGERIVIEDISHHVCPKHCQDFARANNLMACWSEPVVDALGNTLGVVLVYLEHAAKADDYGLALLRHASYLCSIAIERKRLETQMQHQACYDPLTGLPNRRLLGDRLREEIAKAERGGYSLTVLFIDLDRFKEVNDTLGHEAGDSLLIEAAQRIRTCVRESDTVARLAGDEFVVILPEVGETAPQNRAAQSIVESMARPIRIGEHIAYVSASIGIAGYPQDADNVETLMGCADQAMYAAKEAGRNNFSFFTRRMQELARQRLHLTGDLRDALGKGQLEVYYQPIIDVASGLPVKAEALLRWRHPQHGMVSPEQFIPIAEETGLIQEIGAWVFREAVDTAKRWNALTEEEGTRQISVNMSPRQFVRGNPDVLCIEYLQAIGINPKAVVIEITEGLLLDDQADVLNKLRHFHEAGMELALDDFGTGYSAMAYLKKFNIDYIKIDRSFVRDLETDPSDRAIAEAIVAMAHRLGLKVIAEGVETEGQRTLLMAAGCEYVQGYLYAKPMPVEMFLEYVLGR